MPSQCKKKENFYTVRQQIMNPSFSPTPLDPGSEHIDLACSQTNPILTRCNDLNALTSNTIDPTLILNDLPYVFGALFETSTIENPPITATTEGLMTGFPTTQESELYSKAPCSEPHMQESPLCDSCNGSPPGSVYRTEEESEVWDSNRQDTDNGSSSAENGPHKQKHASVGKMTHNIIEKRYRTKLNDKITILRDCVPSLRTIRSLKTTDRSKKGRMGVEDQHISVSARNITKV